jgi:hypothetical protein
MQASLRFGLIWYDVGYATRSYPVPGGGDSSDTATLGCVEGSGPGIPSPARVLSAREEISFCKDQTEIPRGAGRHGGTRNDRLQRLCARPVAQPLLAVAKGDPSLARLWPQPKEELTTEAILRVLSVLCGEFFFVPTVTLGGAYREAEQAQPRVAVLPSLCQLSR